MRGRRETLPYVNQDPETPQQAQEDTTFGQGVTHSCKEIDATGRRGNED